MDYIKKTLKKIFGLSVYTRTQQFLHDLSYPQEAQKRRLLDITGANQSCEFGREYGFFNIKNVDDFRKQLPISSYNNFSDRIQRMRNGEDNVLVSQPLTMFGVTSGTTKQPKFIPITRRWTIEHHSMHLMWMWNMIKDRPLDIVGKILSIVSPASDGITPGRTPFGSSSGMQYRDQSIPIRMLHPVPYEAFLVGNCMAKYHIALAFAMGSDLKTVTSVNPSTLVLLAKILDERADALIDDLERGELNNVPDITPSERNTLAHKMRPRPERARKLREILRAHGKMAPRLVWPNVCAINTWQGGCAPFYLDRVRQLWGNAPQRCLGLRATEGTFSIPLEDHTPSGVIAVGGHFMEFTEGECKPAPDSPTLLAHELEEGKKYRLIITTSGGLYRYDIGDIITVTGRRANTPEIAFLHKAGGVLSITGEKVCEEQLQTVVEKITRHIPIEDFTVTIEMEDTPRYILAIECENHYNPKSLLKALIEFDQELEKVNIEYKEKRASGRLAKPAMLILAPGSYREHRFHQINQGRPDGQIKPPHIAQPSGHGRIPVAGDKLFEILKIIDRVNLEE